MTALATMEPQQLVLLALPAVLVVLAGMAYLSWRAEKQRREALRLLADQLQYEFEAEPVTPPAPELGGLYLFTHGHRRVASNLLRGQVEHQPALLFDYRYTVGSGKNSHTYRQSVVAFALGDRAALPNFELRPENIFHKLGSAFGYQDIDFPDYPRFSSRYLVRGADEAAVRALFDSGLVESFENAEHICLEGGGRWLVIYRASQRLAADRIPDFLEEARTLRAAFARTPAVRGG